MRNLIVWIVLFPVPVMAQSPGAFTWPDGKTVAVSLSFDDGRESQIDVGLGVFESYGALATFYVTPAAVERRLEGWRRAKALGHEIGNHSLNHPCSGNFAWSRERALETYTIERMKEELLEANGRIDRLLGGAPESFAYPCGQTFVGRGGETRSYVPVVAELFESGRGWRDEAPNDPSYVDMAQLTGVEMDGETFEEIRALIEQAREDGRWLVLAGHEIGDGGSQTTNVRMLERLIRYAKEPSNDVWLAPVGTVARYVLDQRSGDR